LVRRLRRRSKSTVEFVRADLSRHDDVRSLAAAITRRYEHVDVLINNAGARINTYHETSDGVELTFAANHLGHFLLTSLLLEPLMKAPAARVVTLTSGVHSSANAERGWYFGRDGYDGALAYANSKLANLLFAYELARRLSHTRVTSNAINPGIVATNFDRNNGLRPWLGFLVGHFLKRRLVSARTGAETVIYLAASEQVAGVTEKYFVRNREVQSAPASYDREQARRLWDLSARLTGLPAGQLH
jgi:NAD(P)-dependent dehydrogenase (short-subunit alcohol dehydrogenase family)